MDNLLKASADGKRPQVARLSEPHVVGSGSFVCHGLDGWADQTSFVVYEVDDNGNPIDGTETDWIAVRSGDSLGSAILTAGSDRSYENIDKTFLVTDETSEARNRLITALLKTLNPDGSLKNSIVKAENVDWMNRSKKGSQNPDFNQAPYIHPGSWNFAATAQLTNSMNMPEKTVGVLTTETINNLKIGEAAWAIVLQTYKTAEGAIYTRRISASATASNVTFSEWWRKDLADKTVKSSHMNWATLIPIGEIKLFDRNVNPNTLFPGTTWVRIKNVFLWAGDDAGAYRVGLTGGEYSHKLTVDEMPSHGHGNYTSLPNQSAGWISGQGVDRYLINDGRASNLGGYRLTANTHNTGGGQSHNNMPPFLSVYCWKRTA